MFRTWYGTFVAQQMQAPDIGAKIKQAREEIGLTQIQLALELGQAERTVQAWERNERTPRLPALTALAERTEKPVAFFYGVDDDSESVTDAAA